MSHKIGGTLYMTNTIVDLEVKHNSINLLKNQMPEFNLSFI